MNVTWIKEAGSKPSKQLLQEASTMVRPNTKDHLVIAMALRQNGVTQTEVIRLLGKPHRNVVKKLLQHNKVKQFILPDGSRATRIKLVVRK